MAADKIFRVIRDPTEDWKNADLGTWLASRAGESPHALLAARVPSHSARLATHRPQPFAHIALPGDHRPRRSRGRFFDIDLINKLEADSRAARPHRQLVMLRFDQFV
jgi:hypothetical protein